MTRRSVLKCRGHGQSGEKEDDGPCEVSWSGSGIHGQPLDRGERDASPESHGRVLLSLTGLGGGEGLVCLKTLDWLTCLAGLSFP